jgi:hypothetical protein
MWSDSYIHLEIKHLRNNCVFVTLVGERYQIIFIPLNSQKQKPIKQETMGLEKSVNKILLEMEMENIVSGQKRVTKHKIENLPKHVAIQVSDCKMTERLLAQWGEETLVRRGYDVEGCKKTIADTKEFCRKYGYKY